ncbi:MAG: hypothetical protein K8R23_10130 [Chthoniobacter sp.]|nr:hypothetical protein [Chthoniobacter sp.]
MKRRLRFLAACVLPPAAVLAFVLLRLEPLPDIAHLPPALAALGTRAVHGDATAQYELSRHYGRGDGVPSDDVTAFRWCRAAARRGYAEAQFQLAHFYFSESGMQMKDHALVVWLNWHLPRGHIHIPMADERSLAAGNRWLRAAADNGHAGAQQSLAQLYISGGRGYSPDPAEAAKWYARAVESYRRDAAQGSAEAPYCLGRMYWDGRGVPQDLAEAAQCMKQGAERGYAEAQYNLAIAYERGIGVRKDEALAAEWYFRAVEQGHHEAKWFLAHMYADGRGVTQSAKQAVKLFHELADDGSPGARGKLAFMYLEGSGVAKDEVEGWKWWLVSGGPKASEDREKIEALVDSLTPEQRAEAWRRVDEYKATHRNSFW